MRTRADDERDGAATLLLDRAMRVVV